MAHALWFLGGFVVAWTLACLMVAARRDKPVALDGVPCEAAGSVVCQEAARIAG
jgi:NaMN:DMB phosphoribosyltransferase